MKKSPDIKKPKMPSMWSWFLIKPKYADEDICVNAYSKLCELCQDDCNLARGHNLSDDYIYKKWMEIVKKY